MKYKIGQKVIVCGELITTITRIEKDKYNDVDVYFFNDKNGKEWAETEEAISLYSE